MSGFLTLWESSGNPPFVSFLRGLPELQCCSIGGWICGQLFYYIAKFVTLLLCNFSINKSFNLQILNMLTAIIMDWAFWWCKFHSNKMQFTMLKTDPNAEATKTRRLNLYPHTVLWKYLSFLNVSVPFFHEHFAVLQIYPHVCSYWQLVCLQLVSSFLRPEKSPWCKQLKISVEKSVQKLCLPLTNFNFQ